MADQDYSSWEESKLRAEVAKQGEHVRNLKEAKAPKDEVNEAVARLKKLKVAVQNLAPSDDSFAANFNRPAFEDLLKRRFFIAPAFEIYGGVAGLYDFGPPGCALKANLVQFWRRWFIIEESMLELHGTSMTPEVVLKTSGHVERFTDLMVRDEVTHEHFRADHLLEGHLQALLKENKAEITAEQRKEMEILLGTVDSLSAEDLDAQLKKYGVKSPSGNSIGFPTPFNLMFKTSIGPGGYLTGYLRPETAQGIFVNFKRLLEFNGGRLPFASAQIGSAFRNEIAPRAGLLRVREFEMAEIEHFVHPEEKDHINFDAVKDMKLTLLSRDAQLKGEAPSEVALGDAVAKGMISNQTLAYFMARTNKFMMEIGVNAKFLRFRQHLTNEMAHYACDCWDAEIETSYGWVECVGHADRACYDLQVHSDASGVTLDAFEKFDKPITVDALVPVPNKGVMGKTFKKESKAIMAAIEALDQDKMKLMKDALENDGTFSVTVGDKTVEITKEMMAVEEKKQKLSGRRFFPHVIEPSFGLGRIIYSVLEHAYYTRESDAKRAVLKLAPVLAPIKCSILPLSGNDEFTPYLKQLERGLSRVGISNKVDSSGAAVGRRYARTDEIGIPFGITVDFDTDKYKTVTLRERDTMGQVRIPIDEVPAVVADLCEHVITWSDVTEKYPIFEGQEANK